MGDFMLPVSNYSLIPLSQSHRIHMRLTTSHNRKGKNVGRVSELPAFKHALQWDRQIYCLHSSVFFMFVLSPVGDGRPLSPNKNAVRDSPVRHEIDFVLTKKGISFCCTVNQIIPRNEGKMRVKSLTSNTKSDSLQPVVSLTLKPVQ